MAKKPNEKKWRAGDLVLHEADPKIHAMLMEVLKVEGEQARTVYLDPHIESKAMRTRPGGTPSGSWHAIDKLYDPALFLKTEEFIQTLRWRARYKPNFA